MRINKYVADALGIARRKADILIDEGKITLNGTVAEQGISVSETDTVVYNGSQLKPQLSSLTIALHKPTGYVCSRNGQGSRTIYDLLPADYQHLNPAGRLDKDSSGLLLLSSDGKLIEQLTHPRYDKDKVYRITTNRELTEDELQRLRTGIQLDDGISIFKQATAIGSKQYEVVLTEGRNRQIRRTFGALKHWVKELHRTQFGPYKLNNLKPGDFRIVTH